MNIFTGNSVRCQEIYIQKYSENMLLCTPTNDTHRYPSAGHSKVQSCDARGDRAHECRAQLALPSLEKSAIKTGKYYFVVFN